LRIDVSLLPGQDLDAAGSLFVVVDVLRASSSIVTLMERGVSRVVVAAGIEEARELSQRLPDHLLCGERGGLPPQGFHYGNSPVEFTHTNLEGKGAILATSNGTRLLAALAEAPIVVVGSLLNRTACARAVLASAREQGLDISVACSAAYGGSTFVLEDALGAAAILDAAIAEDATLEVSDAARFARDAFLTASSDLSDAVASSYHARELTEAGFAEDVAYCSRMDVSQIVPLLLRGEDGVLVLRPARLPQT
jgi:2-phosphosulfolactate phosphatase